MFFLVGLKFAFALVIGMTAYPIMLVYNIIRSQKTKCRVRIWAIIVISTVVLLYSLGVVAAILSQ